MKDTDLVLSTLHNGIATLVLNKPSRMNAIDPDMAHALSDAVQQIADEGAARVVLLRGAGSAFCAGGDISAMEASQHDLPGFIERTIEPFHAAVLGLRRLPMPVMACVHGAAAGGGFSLALACDMVLAASSARFVVAYPKLGAPADGGLSFSLTQRLGPVRGFEMLTIGSACDARQALALNLVNGVVDDDDLETAANEWARKLMALTPQSLQELKGLVAAQSIDAFAAHLVREKAAFLRCAATPEFAARVTAFIQKSRPA